MTKHWADKPILRDLFWFLVLPFQWKQWARKQDQRIVQIGEWIDGYGEVEAVGFVDGERYYWLNNNGVISMQPATVIEPEYDIHGS